MTERVYDIGALAAFLDENGGLRWFITDIFAFGEIIAERTEVADYLSQPHLPAERKLKYLEHVVTPFIHPGFEGFLTMLIHNGDFGSYDYLRRQILLHLERERGFIFAEIVSAVRLLPEEMRRIRRHFEESSGKQIFTYNSVSPRTVVAGFMVKWNEKMIDLSAMKALQQARVELLDMVP